MIFHIFVEIFFVCWSFLLILYILVCVYFLTLLEWLKAFYKAQNWFSVFHEPWSKGLKKLVWHAHGVCVSDVGLGSLCIVSPFYRWEMVSEMLRPVIHHYLICAPNLILWQYQGHSFRWEKRQVSKKTPSSLSRSYEVLSVGRECKSWRSSRALMAFSLGTMLPCLLVSGVLLNKLFNLSH